MSSSSSHSRPRRDTQLLRHRLNYPHRLGRIYPADRGEVRHLRALQLFPHYAQGAHRLEHLQSYPYIYSDFIRTDYTPSGELTFPHTSRNYYLAGRGILRFQRFLAARRARFTAALNRHITGYPDNLGGQYFS